MKPARFDFSNLSKVKDGLRDSLLEEYMSQDKAALHDDMLDYAVAAGTANYLIRKQGEGHLTAEQSEYLRIYLGKH